MLNTGETSINKLIILFVFDKMESTLSERTIVDMCSSTNNWMGYMDCVNVIHKLIDDNFIYIVNEDEDTLYTITPDGRETLANFYINIPKSVREEISQFVKKKQYKIQKPSGMPFGLLSEFGRFVYRRVKNSCTGSTAFGA